MDQTLTPKLEQPRLGDLQGELGPSGGDLALDPSARRQGAGRALVGAAIAWCRKRNLARVMLWTSTRNDAARELFLAAGFRPTMTEMTIDLD